MAIISFAYTEDEYRAGIKTVTRRDWKPAYMERWQKWYDEGKRTHQAWTKVPFAGGEPIGRFRLTARPYWEKLEDMPRKTSQPKAACARRSKISMSSSVCLRSMRSP